MFTFARQMENQVDIGGGAIILLVTGLCLAALEVVAHAAGRVLSPQLGLTHSHYAYFLLFGSPIGIYVREPSTNVGRQ